MNEQLEKMGHNIGVRIIDEFLAKSGVASCSNFKETGDTITKVAFKMFLGISAEVTNMSGDGNTFHIAFFDNPFIDFVELPPQYHDLCYCKLLCGVIKGALEMVQLQVECTFVKDMLKGDEVNDWSCTCLVFVKMSYVIQVKSDSKNNLLKSM